jgi:putative membrane protein
MRAIRRIVSLGLLGSLLVIPASIPAVAQSGAPAKVTHRQSVQTELDPSGEAGTSRVYTQVSVEGSGSVDVVLPDQATGNLRNLEGFGNPTVNGDTVTYTVDGNADGIGARTVADSTAEQPVDVAVVYELDGEPVEPRDVVGKSGTLTITYTVRNMTSMPEEITYFNGQGQAQTETVDVSVPMVGSLSTTLDARFTDVTAPGAAVAGDGRGNTVVNASLLLFAPLGSDTAVATWTAEVTDAVVPPAKIQILPVNSRSFGSIRSGQDSFKSVSKGLTDLTNGALIVDGNAKLLADGAGQLFEGLEQLEDGAGALNAGLAGSAAPGARQLADGLGSARTGGGELADGLGDLSTGAGSLSAGLSTARKGGGDLAAGLGELSAGAGTLSDGLGTARSGSGALASGLGDLAGGAGQLSGGLSTAAAGGGELREGLDQLAVGAGELSAGLSVARAGADELAGGLETLEEGSAGLSAGLTGAKAGSGQLAGGLASLQQQLEASGGGTADSPLAPILAAVVQLAQGAAGLDAALAQLDAGGKQVAGGAALASGGAAQLAGGLAQLDAGGKQVAGGAALASGGAGALVDGLAELDAGGKALAGGAAQASSGADALAGGLVQLDDGAGQLAAGSITAREGAQALSGGLVQLDDGASQLAAGSIRAREGSQALADGLVQLDDGAEQLADGLEDAADGSGQLAEGAGAAAEGGEKVADGTVALSEQGIGAIIEGATDAAGAPDLLYEHLRAADRRGQSPDALPYGTTERANTSAVFSYELAGLGADEGPSMPVQGALAMIGLALMGGLGLAVRGRVV